MKMAKLEPGSTADREMILSRLINAPRTLVFDAFTDPEHIGNWWGPDGFTITTTVRDVRVGGMWRFMMHGPDGTDYPNRIVYTEIVRPERIAYNHGEDVDNDPNMFKVWVTFEDQHGKTQLTMRMLVSSAAALQEMKKFGAQELGMQTLAKLEAYLATLQARP
jgi:uncharacterized protein YndB with AHSA1/START domain